MNIQYKQVSSVSVSFTKIRKYMLELLSCVVGLFVHCYITSSPSKGHSSLAIATSFVNFEKINLIFSRSSDSEEWQFFSKGRNNSRNNAESIEYSWVAFSPSYDLLLPHVLPPPSPVSKLSLFISLPVCCRQCFGSLSGSGLDTDSIRSEDPDLYSESGSGSVSMRAKMTHKNRKKLRNFMFWNALLRAEGFSCSLDVLCGGLGISKLQFLIFK